MLLAMLPPHAPVHVEIPLIDEICMTLVVLVAAVAVGAGLFYQARDAWRVRTQKRALSREND
jgi:hypothetical protein